MAQAEDVVEVDSRSELAVVTDSVVGVEEVADTEVGEVLADTEAAVGVSPVVDTAAEADIESEVEVEGKMEVVAGVEGVEGVGDRIGVGVGVELRRALRGMSEQAWTWGRRGSHRGLPGRSQLASHNLAPYLLLLSVVVAVENVHMQDVTLESCWQGGWDCHTVRPCLSLWH